MPLVNITTKNNTAPLVRTSNINLQSSQTALDSGAFGIQFPNINNIEDAIEACSCTKYPPLGKRGFSPFVAASDYINNGADWNNQQNADNCVVLNIEGVEAVNNVEEILIEDLDCILLVYSIYLSL